MAEIVFPLITSWPSRQDDEYELLLPPGLGQPDDAPTSAIIALMDDLQPAEVGVEADTGVEITNVEGDVG